MTRKKKRKSRKKPKFRKYYRYDRQDECFLAKEKLLQSIHCKLAQELFGEIPNFIIGDWILKTGGINLFVDPVFGAQAEISGTLKMPLLKRVKIHIWLLRKIRSGCSILKAVKECRLMYQIQ